MPPCNRTTARGFLILIALAACIAAAPVGARPDAAKVPPLIFPVLGGATYTNDFGDARGTGTHEGNDLMAPKRSIAVAVESGTVKFWTTSANAGCMLYLDGDSGTQYLYIHLNNDLTRKNDNTGKCIQGVSYAPGLKDGDWVQAGQPVGFVGDSGDANGIASHLHFEVHPKSGAAVNGRPGVTANRSCFAFFRYGYGLTAALRGEVVGYDGSLTLDVDRVTSYPGSIRIGKVNRRVKLSVPPETLVFDPVGALIEGAELSAMAVPGEAAVAWTAKATSTLEAALGEPLQLATNKIELGSADE